MSKYALLTKSLRQVQATVLFGCGSFLATTKAQQFLSSPDMITWMTKVLQIY